MEEMESYLGWKIDFAAPAGEPAYCAPDSVRWKVFKNPVTSVVAGVCAVLLEFADDRIRSGVWDHSVFPTDPVGRGRRTGLAAYVGIYGPQSAARRVIQGVTNMHARVEGTTPNGRAYKALDPELLNWVAATASYGWLMAYDRFAKKLTDEEKQRFWSEGEEVAKLYGVTYSPKSLDDFYAMMGDLEADFEPHAINSDFLEIIRSGRAARVMPKRMQRAFAHAAIDILPPAVRRVLGLGSEYDLTTMDNLTVRAAAWAAETFPDKNSPPAQASERLGLPRDFLWRSSAAQTRLLQHVRTEERSGELQTEQF